ncbi:DUF6787 family protein [Oceanihabitans sediminis]|uniref:Diacylglyceryl transferase n=1 Tax=Oceanihabitans sediminis TaxID=1812012 RepID=A0A368P5A6_9FLAO|nr:DUF6787 family protein [Oceanihabitans sediminis]MDX1277162.1 DUF6787 family protein [Oceanihabitans sediminis]MDX1773580.1 DUF6787 family protein [Oceanihabitans sediminis]RBP33024.1 hypothetical protein DFR65_102360 [Oceanihabitans sediminis]RCU57460.1 diacylglyceryl transferase [Oceanihabitans sediminis]
MEKLKKRWGIDSNKQVIIILFVFAVTGSTASFIGKPILAFLDITPETLNTILYWVIRIVMLFVMYQFLLIFFGWLFGQFNFFWNFEKKMLTRIGLGRFLKE